MIEELAFKKQSPGLDYSVDIYHQHRFHMRNMRNAVLVQMVTTTTKHVVVVRKHHRNMFKTPEEHSSCSTLSTFSRRQSSSPRQPEAQQIQSVNIRV